MTLNQLIYRASRPLGGLQLARYLSRRHPKILMYHRIMDTPDGEGITPEEFQRHVEIVKENFYPLTLKALMEAFAVGEVPKHAVVITFDDGYSDFGDVAFPILNRYKVPATLFVTTGFVNGDLWLWPDQIKYALENTNIKKVFIDELSKEVKVSDSIKASWHQIADYCMTINNNRKIEFIDKIFSIFNVEKPNLPPDFYKPLSWAGIASMVNDGLDVGSHSYSHPIMSKLDESSLKNEIHYSRQQLIDNIGVVPSAFCYPNGLPGDYNSLVIDEVYKAGYEYAVTAFPGKFPLENIWEIRRYNASSNIEEFERTLYGMSYLNIV